MVFGDSSRMYYHSRGLILVITKRCQPRGVDASSLEFPAEAFLPCLRDSRTLGGPTKASVANKFCRLCPKDSFNLPRQIP